MTSCETQTLHAGGTQTDFRHTGQEVGSRVKSLPTCVRLTCMQPPGDKSLGVKASRPRGFYNRDCIMLLDSTVSITIVLCY